MVLKGILYGPIHKHFFLIFPESMKLHLSNNQISRKRLYLMSIKVITLGMKSICALGVLSGHFHVTAFLLSANNIFNCFLICTNKRWCNAQMDSRKRAISSVIKNIEHCLYYLLPVWLNGCATWKDGYDLPAGCRISSNIDHFLSHLSAHILISSVPTKNYVISVSYFTHLLLKIHIFDDYLSKISSYWYFQYI